MYYLQLREHVVDNETVVNSSKSPSHYYCRKKRRIRNYPVIEYIMRLIHSAPLNKLYSVMLYINK